MTDKRISMTRRVRLPKHWDFFEAVQEAHRRDATKLLAILRDGDDHLRTFTLPQVEALVDLIDRKVHRRRDNSGRRGDLILYGNKRHAAETVFVRAKAEIATRRAERGPRGQVSAAEKLDCLRQHKQDLTDEGHRNAESVDLDMLMRRLKPRRKKKIGTNSPSR